MKETPMRTKAEVLMGFRKEWNDVSTPNEGRIETECLLEMACDVREVLIRIAEALEYRNKHLTLE